MARARWLVEPRRPYPHGIAVDQRGIEKVQRAARDCDLVWFYKLRTANMFPEWAWRRSVVDIDDVPSLFEQSELSSAMTLPARLATTLRVKSWQRRERLIGERFSVLTVCSEADRRYLTRLGITAPLHIVANGHDRPIQMPVRRLASSPRLGFIGVFDHAPNAAGVAWFVDHCWPLIKREIPDARFRVVGRFTDGPLKPVGDGIDALGYVADANDEMATWAAMVVPVLTGAGTRGKIAHAFSQKCPVVSTRLGAYGFDPTHGQDMLLADSAKEFAEACVRAIRYPDSSAEIAERAWGRFLARWTWDAIQPQIWAAARECLSSAQERNSPAAFDIPPGGSSAAVRAEIR
jgi:glycosyltransferase involved in cell wall biosynthesis